MSSLRIDDITQDQIIKKFHTLYRNSAATKVAYGRKSELCSCWLKAEHCKYYDSPQGCHYAHGWSDVQPRIFERNLFKVKPCLRIDKCTYKTRCQFCHDDVVYVLDQQLQVFFSEKEKNYRISLRLENSNILVFTLAEPKFPERDPFVLELKPYFNAMKKKVQPQDPCHMHRNRNNNMKRSNASDSRRNKNMFQPTLANIVPATSVCTLAQPQYNMARPQPLAVNPHAQPLAPQAYYSMNQLPYFQNQTYCSPVYPAPAYRQDQPTWVPPGYVYQPQTPQQTMTAAVSPSTIQSPTPQPPMQMMSPQLQHTLSNQSFTMIDSTIHQTPPQQTIPQQQHQMLEQTVQQVQTPMLQQHVSTQRPYDATTHMNASANGSNNSILTVTNTAFENLVQSMNLDTQNNVSYDQNNMLNSYSMVKPTTTLQRQIEGPPNCVTWLGNNMESLAQNFGSFNIDGEMQANNINTAFTQTETISPPPGISESNTNLLNTPTRTCKKQNKFNPETKENALTNSFSNANVLHLVNNSRDSIQYLRK